jgi:hypothetical protein
MLSSSTAEYSGSHKCTYQFCTVPYTVLSFLLSGSIKSNQHLPCSPVQNCCCKICRYLPWVKATMLAVGSADRIPGVPTENLPAVTQSFRKGFFSLIGQDKKMLWPGQTFEVCTHFMILLLRCWYQLVEVYGVEYSRVQYKYSIQYTAAHRAK